MGGSGFVYNIEYCHFDNFWKCSFLIDNKEWTSSEQAYQALKFDNEEHIEKIRKEESIGLIIYHGHSKELNYRDGFTRNRLRIRTRDDSFFNNHVKLMYKVNFEKYKQNEYLKEELLKTKNSKIIFNGSTPFWNKWNSIILEKIKENLMSELKENLI
jgi:predicted NAD-dependent protein-ADP-ribosyltransferase YbiA (DUF1768 family)